MKNTILSILMIAGIAVSGDAHEKTDSLEFFFPQGKSRLLPGFGNNTAAISRIESTLSDTSAIAARISGMRIIGAASPEGSVSLNERLSMHRAEEIERYISGLRSNVSPDIPSVIPYELDFLGRDWHTLRQIVETDEHIPYREEVMETLDSILADIDRDGGEKESEHNLSRIKSLRGGIPYSYLYQHIFPVLRNTRVLIDYRIIPRADYTLSGPWTTATVVEMAPVITPVVIIPIPNREGRDFYMSLRTNMLYDAAALPTLGAEFYLGRNFSIGGNWTYGWWDRNSAHRYWRAYGGDLNLRWWFGRKAHQKPLTGHHIGIFAGITTYDFEFGGEGRMGGIPGGTLWDRNMKIAGVEYGYSLPIARRLNLDFTLGVGYMGGKVVKYRPRGDEYLWESTNKLNWFGPVKAEVSLVWLIGHGNYNEKGGKL